MCRQNVIKNVDIVDEEILTRLKSIKLPALQRKTDRSLTKEFQEIRDRFQGKSCRMFPPKKEVRELLTRDYPPCEMVGR